MNIKIMAALLACGATPAGATTLLFSYVYSSNTTIGGSLDGTVSVDGKTFTAAGVNALTRNGVNVAGPLTIISTDRAYGFGSGKPTLRLDGSLLDFSISDGDDQIAFAVGNSWARFVGTSVGLTSGFGGNDDFSRFKPAALTISVVAAAVPEPAAWAMMIAGFGLVGATLRHGRRATPGRALPSKL